MTRTKKKTQSRRRKKPQARGSKTRRAPSSNDLRVAALLSFEHFKRVFSHPSVDFERTVSFGFAADSALLMACHSDGRDTIAKARWLVDHGASVCKLLEHRGILGDWRVGVNATLKFCLDRLWPRSSDSSASTARWSCASSASKPTCRSSPWRSSRRSRRFSCDKIYY